MLFSAIGLTATNTDAAGVSGKTVWSGFELRMWARIVIALGADKTPLHARSRPTTCPEQVRFGSLDRRLEVATLNSTPAGCGRGGTAAAAASRAARRTAMHYCLARS